MTYSSIPDAKREIGKPIDKDLVDNIHDNLEDLNTRLNSISLAVGSSILLNQLFEGPRDFIPIGTVLYSSLSLAQFTAQVEDDGEWVLADGSNVAGSDWATVTGRTTLPDVRGRFLRAKDYGAGNNADGDKALDSYTADSTKAHTHDMTHNHSNTFGLTGATTFASSTHTHVMDHDHEWSVMESGSLKSWNSGGTRNNILVGSNVPGSTGATAIPFMDTTDRSYFTKPGGVINAPGYTGFGTTPITGAAGATDTVGFSGSVTGHSGNTGSTGANETAPRYVTESAFIKINRGYIKTNSFLFVTRIAQQTTINSILVSPVVQGTSGSFKIDIKKGASPTTATQWRISRY